METLTTITTARICELVATAERRVVYAAPGIFLNTAHAIQDFFLRQSEASLDEQNCFEIIIDSDPEVCRLGYGNFEALKLLTETLGARIRKAEGLRIGVLIVDNAAWIYSPTPQVVEAEPETAKPNAVAVCSSQAERLIASLAPRMQDPPNSDAPDDDVEAAPPAPEIGNEVIAPAELKAVEEDLKRCPPQSFDLTRRVRVYSGLVQFVELTLTGCHLGRHTISLPAELMNLPGSDTQRDRLKATYRLVDETSAFKREAKKIETRVAEIRKTFLRSLGKRLGTVVLKSKKAAFLAEVEQARAELTKFSAAAKANLQTEITACRDELIKTLLPIVKDHPPESLLFNISNDAPTVEQASKYLENELSKVIPEADKLIGEMNLHCDFKDVTYDMLNDKEFQEKLRSEFPYEPFPKFHEEFEAARSNQSLVERENLQKTNKA